jgi:hypothetical protein
MRRLAQRFGNLCGILVLALAILVASSGKAEAQFPAYGGGGWSIGYPGFGFGYGFPGYGFGGFGYPGMGYGYGMGYPGVGFGYGYPGMGYGYGFGMPGYGYGFGNIYTYSSPLYNPMFGVGLTPLGAQSYIVETQLFGRRSRR